MSRYHASAHGCQRGQLPPVRPFAAEATLGRTAVRQGNTQAPSDKPAVGQGVGRLPTNPPIAVGHQETRTALGPNRPEGGMSVHAYRNHGRLVEGVFSRPVRPPAADHTPSLAYWLKNSVLFG